MTASSRKTAVTESVVDHILQTMTALPPHAEVPEALRTLQAARLRLVTLTNSSPRMIDQQIRNAGLESYFERNFSVDAVRRFKPAPEPYRMVAAELGVETGNLRMVAAHAWDIVGAMAGCEGAFVARPGKVRFPLGPQPDVEGPDLLDVVRQILELER